MSSEAIIRNIAASEWQAYRTIRLRALKDSPDAFGSTFESSVQRPDADWIARLAKVAPETNCPMVACDGDAFVGLAWAEIEPEAPADAHLYQMWVAPEVRGRGVGQRLVECAIDWARGRGCGRMLLEVTCGDRPARRLYERLGFKPLGEPFPMREGSELLEQTMELTLTAGE